jgi:phosphoglycerate kinase
MGRELEVLGRALSAPAKPFVAILGGAKISGKIDVITNLLPIVDRMLIGGAMMFTFLVAKGISVGNSLVEADKVDLAKEILAKAGDKLLLPVDCRVATSPEPSGAPGNVVPVTAIPDNWYGVDIGPTSMARFDAALEGARTVLWNGPMGIFEIPAFAEGTLVVAQLVGEATGDGAVTIVGGGDSVAAVRAAGLADEMTHISTGGGASLEFLAGKTLPGVAALSDARKAAAAG